MSTDHTQQLPCPAASSLAAALASQRTRGVEALFDIAEVAEAAGASRMDVWLDARRHPAQSLLQPGLAEFQGPAVCVSIPGAPVLLQKLARISHSSLYNHARQLGLVQQQTCMAACCGWHRKVPSNLACLLQRVSFLRCPLPWVFNLSLEG